MDMDFMRISSLIVSAITLVYAIIWTRKRPSKKGWAVPVIFFMIHSIIFYIALYILPLENKFVNEWSAVKNLHGLITFATYWVAKFYGVKFNTGGN